jgi:diguanylate cyclase (GGDEF)-like protein
MLLLFYQISARREVERLQSVKEFVKQQKSELIINITNNIITEINLQSNSAENDALSDLNKISLMLDLAITVETIEDGSLADLVDIIAASFPRVDILAQNLETGRVFGIMDNRQKETIGDNMLLVELFDMHPFNMRKEINKSTIIVSGMKREVIDSQVLSTLQKFIDAQVPLGDLQISIDLLNCYEGHGNFATRIITPFFQHEQHTLINANNAKYYEGFKELVLNGHVTVLYYQGGERDRIVHARLLRAFDWVVSVSVSAHDINELTNSLAEQFQQQQTRAMIALSIFCVLVILLAIFMFIRIARLYSHRAATEFKIVDDLVHLDALTGIYNRRYLEYGLTTTIELLSRIDGELAILLVDIDCFKPFNDTYGHHMGDMCLKKVANGLKQTLSRANDFVARYGGEEFVVVLPGTDERGAAIIAERMMETMRELAIEHKTSTVTDYVTISIGIASGKVTKEKRNWCDYVNIADKALYHSKKSGRNKHSSLAFDW